MHHVSEEHPVEGSRGREQHIVRGAYQRDQLAEACLRLTKRWPPDPGPAQPGYGQDHSQGQREDPTCYVQ